MILVQYDLFKDEEECRLECIERSIKETKQSSDKVRRGLYAKHAELMNKYMDLAMRMDVIERNICKGE